jgi:hypothetical protein
MSKNLLQLQSINWTVSYRNFSNTRVVHVAEMICRRYEKKKTR